MENHRLPLQFDGKSPSYITHSNVACINHFKNVHLGVNHGVASSCHIGFTQVNERSGNQKGLFYIKLIFKCLSRILHCINCVGNGTVD